MNTATEANQIDLINYIVPLKKYFSGMLVIFLSIASISLLIAYLLPSTYRSSATILIEQQEIPQELVQSTVTSYAAERIQVIQARVMSRSNLMDIVEKFDIYPRERQRKTNDEILEQVAQDISLDLISANVVDPRTGKASKATIAFKLSFENESPRLAQRVTNELTSLYLNENLRNRTQKAEDTAEFFRQESARLLNIINEYDEKITEFKLKNSDSLPGMYQANLSTKQRAEADLLTIDIKIASLEERKKYLESEMLRVEPTAAGSSSPAAKLKALESSYISLQSRYSEQHPDIVRIRKEIESLRAEVGGSRDHSVIARQLIDARAQLDELSNTYSADHPDVKAARSRVTALESRLAESPGKVEQDYLEMHADNPTYISLRSQLSTIGAEMDSLMLRRKALLEKLEQLDIALQQSPLVENEFKTLVREHEAATKLYREAKLKQSRADIAMTLESESKGERFSVIDPAVLPEKPVSPNRPAIILIGIVLAMGCAMAFAFISDTISGVVRGPKGIKSLVGQPPLAVIPYELNLHDNIRKRNIKKRTILVGIAIFVLVLVLIHFFVSPLDVLWFRAVRKFDGMVV